MKFILLIFSLISLTAVSQSAEADSLLGVWQNKKTDKIDRLDAAFAYAVEMERVDPEQIYALVKSVKNEFANDKDGQVRFYVLSIEGIACQLKGEKLEAISLFQRAKPYFDEVKSEPSKVKFLNWLGYVFESAGLGEKALDVQLEVIRGAIISGDELNLAKAYGNIAINYGNLNKEELCEKYHKKSYELFKKLGEKKYEFHVLLFLAQTQHISGKNELAKQNFHRCLAWSKDGSNLYLEASVYDHLGWFYKDLGELDSCQYYFERSIETWKKTPEKGGLISGYIGLADLFVTKNQPKKAIEYGEKALNLAQGFGVSRLIRDAAQGLGKALKLSGNYKRALSYFELAFELERELVSTENSEKVLESDIRLDYILLSVEDSLQNVKNVEIEKQKGEAIRSERNIILWGSLFGGLLLVLFVFFLIRRYRIESHQKGIIEEQKILLEKEYLSLKEFTENASHEMQTPMAIINSKLEGLMQNASLTDEQMGHIQQIYTATYRMSTLNRSLLLLSKIENNQFPLDDTLNISQLFAEILAEFDEMILHKKITKELFISPNITFQTNTFLVSTVFYNLVKNSISHNLEGGKINVSLDSEQLTITNTGHELEGDPDQLFERFKKSGNNENSTGLGLALVKQSCEALGWRVEYTYSEKIHCLKIDFPK